MEIKELKEFSKERNEIIRNKLKLDQKELILVHAVKLGEETGELSEEVLNFLNFQMRDKAKEKNNIEHELADVILVTSVLAESMGIGIEKALKEKMAKIKEKYH